MLGRCEVVVCDDRSSSASQKVEARGMNVREMKKWDGGVTGYSMCQSGIRPAFEIEMMDVEDVECGCAVATNERTTTSERM